MDFLEIRRKAKERAAARAAAAPGPALPARGPSRPAEPDGPSHRPLALDPLPLPAPEAPPAAWTPPGPAAERGRAPISLSPTPEPEPPRSGWAPPPPLEEPEPRPPPERDPEAERLAAAAAEEAARVEAELEARLQDMPTAPDARFRTWRPSAGPGPEVLAAEPEPPAAAWTDERRRAGDGARRTAAEPPPPPPPPPQPPPPADPLDDFFFRDGEPGPELGELAAPLEAAPAPGEVVERIEYLTFKLGAEEYGVEIDRVREVMRSPPITEVPRAPPDVLGVITVRGEVVAVLDPRGRLGLPRAGAAGGGRVVIVDDGGGPFGLVVDAVASVVRLPRGSIEARPQGIGGGAADCLEGIGRDRDRIFTVLSIPALLRPTRKVEGRG